MGSADDPTARFAELASLPADVLPLDEAILLVAAHHHALDLQAQLARLDALAVRCRAGSVESVIEVLFADEAFSGDSREYHHPDNSFLDRVLDRRRGLPILLSIVTAEVAARAGVCLAYVALPGHVVLRDCEDSDRFIDPFNGGRILTGAECLALSPGCDVRHLEPVESRAILLRVVTNLVHSFAGRGEVHGLAWALHLRAIVAGDAEQPWTDVARIRERLGDWTGAADVYDRLARQSSDDDLRQRARAVRARTN
ncbi:MAG: transglutaminase family protein [Acidimicrobiales bacterium]